MQISKALSPFFHIGNTLIKTGVSQMCQCTCVRCLKYAACTRAGLSGNVNVMPVGENMWQHSLHFLTRASSVKASGRLKDV